jgi:hypothetical protein
MLVVTPADTLNRAGVNSTLNFSLSGAFGTITFRLFGFVKAKNSRAYGYAEPAADTAFLIHRRFFHAGPLYCDSYKECISA